MNHYAIKRPTRKRHIRRRVEQETRIALLVAGIILLFLGILIAIGYWSRLQATRTALAYEPQDVATENPIQAIHEMGEGPPVPFLPKDGPQPRVSLSERFYDFGQIGSTDVVQRTFVIRNNGAAPLTISRAYTTCGCTTAEISASVIPPGKVATVKLIFDAGFHETAGQTVRRGLIIENNDPGQPQAEIWVQAAVQSH
jgi:hypothetical protein